MIKFEKFFNKIKEKNSINNNNFYIYIKNFINSWFILLNNQDKEVLYELTFFLYNRIRYIFNINYDDSIYQFTKSDNQDLKALVLLLLPFIIDENTNIYNKIVDLNQILCYKNNLKQINKQILEEKRTDVIKEYFKYSNFAVGLLNEYNDTLLDLYPNNEKLIWTVIHHNFMSLLESLNQINGKLYINWINITPITLEEYKESVIYKNTINNLEETVNKILNSDSILDYNGLYIGEFYNIYRNIFYESIKQIKWLIFPFTINNNKQYIIQYIDNIFDIDDIYNLKDSSYNLKDSKYNLKSLYLNFSEDEYKIWKTIIVFMVNNYSAKNVISMEIKKPFLLNQINEESNDDDYNYTINNIINKIENNDINIFLENIKEKLLIDFFKESIDELKSTFYSKFLFDENKKLYKKFVYVNKSTSLNLKNLYNISKTLSHNNINNKFELLPTKYSSLSEIEKIDFFNKFIGNHLSSWLNIKKNLERENSRQLSNNEYIGEINNINSNWEEIRIDIIFEYLSWGGILSEFNVDKNFDFDTANNKKKLKEEMKNKFKKNKKWEETNYYLTNDKFSKLKYSEIDEKTNVDIKKLTYFEYLINKTQFYTFYAMDWLAQINFFNHYLNNRIMFVTGSTGTGKSTQVPKLLLYSLKCLDYKQNGKVVNTQPRVAPTTANATRIANELGLQINAPNPDFNNELTKTRNFQVQFKHQKNNHVKKSCPYLTLKISTDGTLFEEIVKNPLIKNQVYEKDKKSFIYSEKNKYDIIIIDESHEHNINMDLLITLLRNSAYYNNDIKIVIVSATLEEDEPIYRAYFKYINDNLLYPIKTVDSNHLLLNEPFLIDSVYLDRRFHISPPGKGTQYEIKEIYLSNSITFGDNEKKNSQITQEKGYEIINKICLESTKGDILLFANGQGEIIKAVEILNSILPSDVIALPYFSELNDKYKDLVVNINKKIGFIKTKRYNVAKTWTEDYIEDLSVPNNIYTRAVIIATNVAEASITIDSLKYVVDNGYAKVNNYNYGIDLIQLNEEKISEASRKQRKGRVGRTSDGTVYYIYEKGAREDVQPKFKITQTNYEQYVIKLMNKQKLNTNNVTIQKIYIYGEGWLNYDPNNYIDFIISKKVINEKINIIPLKYKEYYDKYKDNINYKSNIISIIYNQYKQNNLQHWNELYFNFMKEENLSRFNCYLDGFDLNNILDIDCVFYIIHPFEDKIIRNILHIPIEINNKKTKIFEHEEFSKLLNRLENKLLLVNIKPDRSVNNNISFEINTNNYFITELVEYVNKITSLSFIKNFNDGLLMLYAHAYGKLYEIIQIFILIKLSNDSITNLFIDQKLFDNQNYQDNQLEFLFNLVENIKKNFSDLTIFKNIDYNYLKNKYKSNYIELAIKYENTKNSTKKNIDFTYNLYDKFVEIEENDELYTDNGFEKILNVDSIITKGLYNEINNIKFKINNWESQNNLKPDMVFNFLTTFTMYLIDILTIEKDYDKKFEEINPLKFIKTYETQFLKTLNTNNTFDKILKPFIHAYPLNFAINIENNPFYVTSLKTRIINVETELNKHPYLFYFYINNFTNQEVLFQKKKLPLIDDVYEIRLTNKIDIKMLLSALPFYYKPSKFKTKYLIKMKDDENKLDIVYIKNQKWQSLCNKIANSWSNEQLPFEGANELEILSKYIKNIKKELLYE